MGVFDNVKFKMDCPKCGAKITGFQSKDGPCILTTLEYWEVNHFYSSCPQCRARIEFTRKKPELREKIPLSDYDMTVKS